MHMEAGEILSLTVSVHRPGLQDVYWSELLDQQP